MCFDALAGLHDSLSCRILPGLIARVSELLLKKKDSRIYLAVKIHLITPASPLPLEKFRERMSITIFFHRIEGGSQIVLITSGLQSSIVRASTILRSFPTPHLMEIF